MVSAKNKIYAAVFVWIVLCASMFSYFFKILDTANAQAVQDVSSERSQLSTLQAELDSFQLAKKDIKDLNDKDIKPENFFSKDVTLVNELQILEGWSQKYNVVLDIAGLNGVVANAPKAKTKSEISTEAANISISGELGDVLNFIQSLENASFVTSTSALSLNPANNGKVNVTMQTYFYLQQDNNKIQP